MIIDILVGIFAGAGFVFILFGIFDWIHNVCRFFSDCSNTKHKAVINERELATLNKRVIELERSIKPEVTQTGGGECR